ncbi:MAG: tetratricopeptide repeat protein [Candidatus Delongbacteria bacterium]|nr:tetratricopeptide repeat protein [Candidatus Delongbacteria bacterium]MBN2833433.1 tetratricopeptide repeat protein [Candidatus Delongbacteria bacterium]
MFKKLIYCVLLFALTLYCEDISSSVQYGKKLYEEKLYDVAITQFTTFIQNNPASTYTPEARYLLAGCYKAMNDLENREKQLKQILLDFPETDFGLKAIIDLGEMYKDKEDGKAARYFLQAREYFQNSDQLPKIIYQAIVLLNKSNDTKSALDQISFMKSNFPVNDFTYRSRVIEAEIYRTTQNFQKGEYIYKSILPVLKSDDIKSEIIYNYGLFLKNSGMYSTARVEFSKVLDGFSPKVEFYIPAALEFSDLALKEKMYNGVYNLLIKLQNVPEKYQADFYYYLGICQMSRGEFSSSYTTLMKSFDLNKNSSILINASIALKSNGEFKNAAENILNNIDQLSENDKKSALFMAADIYKAGGLLNEAITVFREYYVNYPSDEKSELTAFIIGKTYYESKDFESSYDELFNFVKNYPSSEYIDDAYFYLAESAMKMGDYDALYYAKSLKYFKYLTDRFPASDFYQLSNQRINYLNNYKIKGDNILDKLAEVTLGKSDENSKLSFIFYELKNYNLAKQISEKMIDVGINKDEINYIYAISTARTDDSNKQELEKSQEILTRFISGDYDRKKIINAFFVREEIVRRLYPSSDIKSLIQDLELEAIGKNIDDKDGSIFYNYCQNMILGNDDPDRVIKFCDNYLSKYPTSIYSEEVKFIKGTVFDKNGNRDLASMIFEEIIKKNSGRASFLALNKLVDYARNADDVADYASRIERDYYYTTLASKTGEIIADAMVKKGDYRRAIELYTKELEKISGDTEFGFNLLSDRGLNEKLGNLYLKIEDYAKAEMYLKEAYTLVSDPDNSTRILKSLSQVYEKSENLSALKVALSEISRLNEGAGAYESDMVLADIEFNNKNYKAALDIYYRAQKDPEASKDSNLQFKIVKTLFRLNNDVEAEKAYKLVKNIEDEVKAEYFLEKGNSFLRKKSWDKALDSYEDLLDIKSTFIGDGLYGKALVYYNIGKKDQAFEIWKEIVDKYPGSGIFVETNYYLGSIYLNQEKQDMAIASLQNVINYPREHELKVFAYRQLIDLYKKLEFYDAALKLLRDYVELYPDNDDIFDKRIDIGVILQKNKEFDSALDYLEKLKPETSGENELAVQFYIAETFMLKRDFRRAISEFLKVKFAMINNTPYDWKITAVYKAAQCYEQLGENDKALALYEEILQKYSSDTKYGKQAVKSIEKLKNNME